MNLKKYFLYLLIFVVIFCAGFQDKGSNKKILNHKIYSWSNFSFLGIEEAFMISITDNPSIEVIALKIYQARERIKQNESKYWPFIGVNGIYDLKNGLGFEKKDCLNNYRLSLNMRWCFFDGFQRKYRKIFSICDEQIATNTYENFKRILFLTLSTAYHRAQFIREKIKIAMINETFNKRKLAEADIRYKYGLESLKTLLDFKLKFNKSKVVRKIEERDYKFEMINLASVIGCYNTNFILLVNLAPFYPTNIDEMINPQINIDLTITKRPDINIKKLIIKQAKALIYMNISDNYPSANLYISFITDGRNELDFFKKDITSNFRFDLSYNLFSGNFIKYKIKESIKYKIESEKNMLTQLILLKKDIEKSFLRICSIQKEIIIQKKNKELIEKTRNLIKEEYMVNNVSLMNLNEIQNKLNNAKCDLAVLVSTLRQNWIEFKIMTGESLNRCYK